MPNLPKHIAIIMDGNGRWAQKRHLSRIAGHRLGVEVTDSIVTAAADFGIRYLTLYAFSDENWSRPAEEVAGLMLLLDEYLLSKQEKMLKEGIRFKTIGNTERLPEKTQKILANTREITKSGKGLTLILALSYGARNEMLRAVNKIVKSNIQEEITPEIFAKQLYTRNIPDPDLLIRTSGEKRISNFLLWQLAYTELYFTKTLWPEFSREEFLRAIESYQGRERRFGLTSDQLKSL